MKNIIRLSLSLAVRALVVSGSLTQELPREILGVNLKMTKEDAQKRLREIGMFVRNEAGWQEVWKVRDGSFSHLIVGFGKDGKLNYVTAVAAENKEAKRVEYRKIGSLKTARQTGDVEIKNFNYQWDLPSGEDGPHTLVIAAGRDPKFLTTYSLKNLDNAPAKEEKD
jgi:hypothetical protein